MGKPYTLQEIIDFSSYIVFFGGAGVSTESGLPDFRSTDGIYNLKYKYPPEEIISHSFFGENPTEFYEFYKDKLLPHGAQPNAAHKKLAELEAAGILKAVITQNIDGLHQAAGSNRVIELHGSVHKNTCMSCGAKYDITAVTDCPGVPRCRCGGIIKPDVVLYEEQLDDSAINDAIHEISRADTLIIAGTSLTVYPAAGLVRYFKGDNLILINKSATPADKDADLVLHESVGAVLGKINVRKS